MTRSVAVFTFGVSTSLATLEAMGCGGSEEGEADVVVLCEDDDSLSPLPSAVPSKGSALFSGELERLCAEDGTITGRVTSPYV